MGLDPASWMAIAKIGSEFAGGLLDDSGTQRRDSFKGTTADPVSMLTDARSLMQAMAPAFLDYANQSIDLTDSIPQTPGGYSGGALPMDIGLSGKATTNPERLKFKGFGIQMPQFGSTNPDSRSPRERAFQGFYDSPRSEAWRRRHPGQTTEYPQQTTASQQPQGQDQGEAGKELLRHIVASGRGRGMGGQ